MAQWKVLLNHVKSKLTLVTSHKDELQEKLNNYTDEVISRAKSAIEDEREDLSVLSEMNFMLEMALLFLKGLDAQIDDAAVQSTHTALGSVQSIDDESLKTETSNQVDRLKEHESRLNAIEDLINQTNTKLSSKIQELDERALKRMNKRLTDTDKLFTTKMDDMDQQLKQIGTRGTDMMNQNISRLDKVEKRMKKLEAGEKETSSRLAVLEDQLQDVHHIKQTTEELRSKLGTLADKSDLIDVMKSSRQMTQTMKELSAKAEAAEGFVKNSAANRIKEKNRHKEVEDRILVLESNRLKDSEHHTRKLEDVECKYQQVCKIVDDRVYPLRRLLYNLNVLHKRVENREDISKRLDEVAKQVADMSSCISKLDFNSIRCNEGGHYNLNTGMFVAPKDGVYSASVYHIQQGNGEMCLAIYQTESSSGENTDRCIIKMNDYINPQQGPIWFSVFMPAFKSVSKDTVIKDFNSIRCNEGGHYNLNTGMFVAPEDGVYSASVYHIQQGNGEMCLAIYQTESSSGENTLVCASFTSVTKTSSSQGGVTRLKKGDKLFVKLYHIAGDPQFAATFTCFSVGFF